jgi:hypothetical protein
VHSPYTKAKHTYSSVLVSLLFKVISFVQFNTWINVHDLYYCIMLYIWLFNVCTSVYFPSPLTSKTSKSKGTEWLASIHDTYPLHVPVLHVSVVYDPAPIPLSILSWNIRGGLQKKLSDPTFLSVLSKADVSVLTETRTAKFKPYINGYTCYESVPVGVAQGKRGAGGVCIFVSNSVAHAVKASHVHDESMLSIVLHGVYFGFSSDIHIIGTYMPHKTSPFYTEARIRKLQEVLKIYLSHHIQYL